MQATLDYCQDFYLLQCFLVFVYLNIDNSDVVLRAVYPTPSLSLVKFSKIERMAIHFEETRTTLEKE